MQKQKRQRGIILTYEGLQQLDKARQQSESEHNSKKRYTFDQLASITQLDINTIKKVLACEEGVDKRTMENIFTAFNIKLTQNYFSHSPLKLRVDLGEAPCTNNFYGRLSELELLQNWLLQDGCRLVAILGMGGIGKTSLSVKLVEQLQGKYEYVIWRSLREAPSAKVVLGNLIQFLSDEEETEINLPESLNQRVSILLNYLRDNRCLLILDNTESILRSGTRAGKYREGYEDYGEFIKLVGEASHNSCLILTSREKPREVATLEGDKLLVRSLALEGLSVDDGEEILKVKGLCGAEGECEAVVKSYNGNPLALKIVATTIEDLFGGNVNDFLQYNKTVLGDINELLESQFERLSDLEKDIIYWLAINREPLSILELVEDIISHITTVNLLDTLESLIRRSLVEKIDKLLTLQTVVMEYVTNRFIEEVSEEIVSHNIKLFKSHALIKATAKDYVKDAQVRIILKPVMNKLLSAFKNQQGVESHLTKILGVQQKISPLEPGYIAGNIINILCDLGTSLKGYDFSNMVVWQADLRRQQLHNVNFANSDVSKSVFAEAFGGIASVAFSPDGELLAMGDTNGDIMLRKVRDGKQILTFNGHTGWVLSLNFSPDGTTIASSGIDYSVKLWNAITGECLQNLQGHEDEVWSVAWSPNSNVLASGSDDNTIRLWDKVTGKCKKVLQGHKSWVSSIAFSPDGQFLASGSDDHTAGLWNINTGECLKTFYGHSDGIRSIIFSPSGEMLASASEDHTIKLWDTNTNECLKTLYGHSNEVYSVAFSPQGDLLVSSSFDQTVKLWSVDTGQCFKTCHGHSNWVFSVAFNLEGNIVASGSHDQTVKLWSVNTGQCLRTFQGYNNQVSSVTFSPDGQTLASGSHDQTLRLWDVNTGQCFRKFQGHRAAIQSTAFSPDGQILASCSHDHTVKLWDVNTAQCLNTLQGHHATVWSIAFSANGQILASGSDDQTVRLWDVNTAQCLKVFQGHRAAIWSVAFNPQEMILASCALDNTIKFWDISSNKCIKTLEGHESWVMSIAFSPNGELLASTGPDKTLRLWKVNTGECLKILQVNAAWSITVAFSPDSQTIASCHDNTIKLWDVNTGKCIRDLQGHTGRLWSVTFNHDNQILASSGDNETIRLWSIETGECLKTLKLEKPYKCMNIAGIKGLSQAAIATLKTLGAVDRNSQSSSVVL